MKNEIVTSLVLKFNEYVNGLKTAESAADSFGKKSGANLHDFTEKAGKGISKLSTGMQTFTSMLGANLVATSLQSVAQQAVEHARAIDDAEDRLNITLTRTNLTVEEQRKEFERLTENTAPKLADAYAMSEEQVLSLSSTIMAFSGKTGKELDNLVNISIGASSAMGMSAEGVARIIAKGAGDAEGSLIRLGVKFPENATAAQRAAIIQREFGASIQATKDASDDAFGALDRLKNDVFHWLGSKMGGVIAAIQPFIGIIATLPALLNLYSMAAESGTLKTVKLGLANAAASVKMGLLTAAQWLLNVAMGNNPLGAVILGVMALVGAIALAYNKSEGFRKVIDDLWGGIKRLAEQVWKAIKFWAEWLNPIGLAIKGFKYLYDNIEGVRNVIDGLITAVKDAGKWLTDLLGITEENTEADKKAAVAADTKASADMGAAEAAKLRAEYQKKVVEGLDAENSRLDEEIKYNRSQFILADEKYRQALRDKAVSKERLAQLKAEREMWKAAASDEFAVKNAQDKAGEEFDAAGKPKEKEKGKAGDPFKDETDRLQTQLKTNQLLEDIYTLRGIQSKEQADENKLQLSELYNNKLRDVAMRFHKDTTEYEKAAAEARFQIIENSRKREEDEYKKKGEDLQKTLEAQANILRNVGSLLGNDPLDTEAGIIRDNLTAQLDYLQKGLDAGLVTQEAYNAQNFKLYKDADKALADLAVKRIDRAKELADINAELIDDESDSAIAKLDAQFNAENQKIQLDYDNKIIMADMYEAKKELLAKKYTKDRARITEDALKKENILYKASAGLISSVFSKLTDSLKNALGKFFGWNKDNVEKKTDNDIALEKFETDKKLEEIDRQVQTSQISYEEGLLRKQALKEQERKQEEEHVSAMTAIGQTFVDSTIGQLGQLAETYVQQALIQLATKETESTGNLIASIFESIPFPLNTILAAGAFGLVAGLFSGLLSGAEEQKNGIQKRAAGGFVKGGQNYTVNELGEEEYVPLSGGQHTFLAPNDGFIIPAGRRKGNATDMVAGFKEYIKRSLRIGSFAGKNPDRPSKFNANFDNILKNNSIVPTTAPTLSPSYQSGQQQRAISDLQQAVKELRTGGIDLHITMDNIQRGEDLHGVVKSYEVGVDRRAYVNNMG